jgi:hypothetical protein
MMHTTQRRAMVGRWILIVGATLCLALVAGGLLARRDAFAGGGPEAGQTSALLTIGLLVVYVIAGSLAGMWTGFGATVAAREGTRIGVIIGAVWLISRSSVPSCSAPRPPRSGPGGRSPPAPSDGSGRMSTPSGWRRPVSMSRSGEATDPAHQCTAVGLGRRTRATSVQARGCHRRPRRARSAIEQRQPRSANAHQARTAAASSSARVSTSSTLAKRMKRT